MELPKVELPKIELPKIELPKVELPNIDFPNIELPNIELPRLPQPKPRPVRTVTRRSLLFQEGFWRPRHYRPLKEHLPWLASVLPLFLMFCFYYERPGATWRERAGHLLRSTARFVNVALWLVLAAMAVMTFRDAFVASLGTPQGAFTGLAAVLGLGIVGWVWLVVPVLWAADEGYSDAADSDGDQPGVARFGAYLCASGSSAGRFEFP